MSNSLDARERKEGEKDGRKEGGISREMTPFRSATSHVSTRRREAKRATATANAGKVFHFLSFSPIGERDFAGAQMPTR